MTQNLIKNDILIVDDTPDNVKVLSSLLTEQGYKVRKAITGSMAIKVCQTVLPDLILLDILMPEMDGYEVCKRLKSSQRTWEIPIIFISALNEAFDKVKAFEVGGVDYITKPFEVEEVLARVNHQLTIRQLRSQWIAQNAQLAQFNQQLENLNQELQRSNADLEQFAYIASHDLQSPLQVIVSSAEVLRYTHCSHLNEEGKNCIQDIVDATQRMKRLIHNLLAYSTIGKHSEPFKLTNCNQVMQQVLFNLRDEISAAMACITIQDLPVVMGDETQLIRLFQNLVSNAIKFRHPDKRPEILIGAVHQSDEKWRFSVRDNGIGIAAENFERIFKIFHRVQPLPIYPGTGLGLSICKKIVEDHQGQIWVESELDLGTSFYFTLKQSVSQPESA